MILSLVVGLVVICLLWWAINRLMAAFGITNPISTVVQVVFVVLVVLWLIGFISGHPFNGSLR